MAIVKKYTAEVVSIQEPIDNLFTIQMKSLNGVFKYNPGQFLHLALSEYDPSEGWPDSRCFSMQSSPKEELIKITFAVKGIYTTRMANELKTGSIVSLKLPYGDLFNQAHDKENCVFIAGGTGITPFISLFTDSAFSDYKNPVLYAGFRNIKQNLYCNEIDKATELNKSLIVNYIYQEEQGILDISLIYRKSNSKSCFFISGPPIMIKQFKNYLLEQGVRADFILTDEWE